jgi:DNA-binding CsgD family transcriptional regulator/PAS domain-containing protein
MARSLREELIDATYRAVLEPGAWADVMALMGRRFPSTAQTFYLLHRQPKRLQPVALAGIEPQWLQSFDELYFAPDNPWIRLTQRLHLPGVIRTNERLDRFLRERGALYRSSYYNEWMRPQGFKYTIGNTLLSESGVVANITLMRPPDMQTFGETEVRAFSELSKHLTRALQLAIQFERPESSPATISAIDAMPQAIALIDAQRHVLYANPAMESMLRRKHGLSVRTGAINASHADARQRFEACVANAVVGGDGLPCGGPLLLPCSAQRHLRVDIAPLIGRAGRTLLAKPTLLLMATEHGGRRAPSPAAIRALYGCTPSEARLTHLLTEGNGLRQSAQALGITYGTARVYLKIVFDKVGVHTQAQLVARVLGDLATSEVAVTTN